MSIEIRSTGGSGERGDRHRFRILTFAIIAILALVAAGLAAVNAVQGPQLSTVSFNSEASITRSGARMVLQANQPLESIDPTDATKPADAPQWSITPAVDAEVTVQGDTITVRFAELLDYHTGYTVTVNVRGAATGASAHLEHTFTTPDVELFSLNRVASGPDRIVRHTLSGSVLDDVAFEAGRIQEYAVLDDALVVVTLDPSDVPTLQHVSLSDGNVTPISTPLATTISEVHASRSTDLFGYVITNAATGFDDRLFIYDLTGASGAPTAISDAEGEPLAVAEWTFLPGTSSVVIQNRDRTVTLLNPLSEDPAESLGSVDSLEDVLLDPERTPERAPGHGSDRAPEIPRHLPEAAVDPALVPGKRVLNGPDSFFQQFDQSIDAAAAGASALFFTDASGTREVFRPASDTARIADFCLSPNGEYLSVVVVSAEGEPDGYPVAPGSSYSTISYVKVEDGSALRRTTGLAPSWCG